MARNSGANGAEKAKLLRGFAFHVHRKQALADVVLEYIEQELQRGHRKEFRPAAESFNKNGVAAALQTMEIIDAQTAAVLTVLVDGAVDHRLMSDVLEALAGQYEADV